MSIFYDDKPLKFSKEDQINRVEFSKRIAKVIYDHAESTSESIVYGIYGKWGEGKTSVINLIKEGLQSLTNKSLVVIDFNPWLIGSEEKLIGEFFRKISNTLRKSISNDGKEKLAKSLSVIVDIAGLVGFKETAKEVKDNWTKPDSLEDVKNEIGIILKDEGLRIVVFIDDIDRLNNEEIKTIFRLVKLVADFSYTTYVLAFDDEIVSHALNQVGYPSTSRDRHSFIEKIVQVPLNLPLSTREPIYEIILDGLNQIFDKIEAKFSQEDLKTFELLYNKGFSNMILTPRSAKQFLNACLFSLPVLHKEVNLLDLVILEGIRLYYPKLYNFISAHREELIVGLSRYTVKSDHWNFYQIVISLIERALMIKNLSEIENNEFAARALVLFNFLFPQVENKGSRVVLDNELIRNKRIGSRYHIDRYFSYGLDANEISDEALFNLIKNSNKLDVESLKKDMTKILRNDNAKEFIRKIALSLDIISPEGAENLVLAIVTLGDILSQELMPFDLVTSIYANSGELISDLLKNTRDNLRFDITEKAIKLAFPLYLGYDIFLSLSSNQKIARLYSDEEWERLENLFISQALSYFQGRDLINETHILLPSLLFYLSNIGGQEKIYEYTSEQIRRDSAVITHIFDLIIRREGDNHMSNEYILVTGFAEEEVVIEAIRKELEKFSSKGEHESLIVAYMHEFLKQTQEEDAIKSD